MESKRLTFRTREALEGSEVLGTDGRVREPEVLVVGGGVSGCACAAGLAARGMREGQNLPVRETPVNAVGR